MNTRSSFNRCDVYATVTNEIIRAIEAGAREFRMPWHEAHAGLPRNAVTKNHYRGVNTLALWSTSRLRGYASPFWATYRQWRSQGAQVRRGEKASIIFFFKREEEVKDSDDGSQPAQPRTLVRPSFVFNAEQLDGWKYAPTEPEDKTARLEAVDAFISAIGAQILYGGQVACYSKNFDHIRIPERRRFTGTETSSATEAFYSTLLHEHVHWTGHAKRLNRDLSGRFGTNAYAMEELVAELGAAFLCTDFGISVHPRADHAAYVASWLAVLRQQKSAVVTASGVAMAACRYLGTLASKKERAA